MAARYSREMARYNQLKDEFEHILTKAFEKSERPGAKEYVARGLKAAAYNMGIIKNLDVNVKFVPDEYHKAMQIKKEMAQLKKRMGISSRYENRRL